MFGDIKLVCDLVNDIHYKAGWVITATSLEDRFEGTIAVRVDYPAANANREFAPDYTEHVDASATFPVIVADLADENELYHVILRDVLMEIELHEAREFMRVGTSYDAPFHPHQVKGMRAWQRLGGRPSCAGDLKFGIA